MAFASAAQSLRDSVNAIFDRSESNHEYSGSNLQPSENNSVVDMVVEAKQKERRFLKEVIQRVVDQYCQIMEIQELNRSQLEKENVRLVFELRDAKAQIDINEADAKLFANKFKLQNRDIEEKNRKINIFRKNQEELVIQLEKCGDYYFLLKHKTRDSVESLLKEISDLSVELRIAHHVLEAQSYTDGFIAQAAIPVFAAPDEKYVMLMKVPEQQESIELMKFIQSQLIDYADIVSSISGELRKAQCYEEDIRSLTEDRNQLKKELFFQNHHVSVLHELKLEMEEELKEIGQSQQTQFALNAELHAQINSLRLELHQKNHEVRALNGEIKNLKEEKDDRKQAMKALEGKNKELREKLRDVKSEFDEFMDAKLKVLASELRVQIKEEYKILSTKFMKKCEARAEEICNGAIQVAEKCEFLQKAFLEKISVTCNQIDDRATEILNTKAGDDSDLRFDVMGRELELAQKSFEKLQQEYEQIAEYYQTSESNCKILALELSEVKKQLHDCVTQSDEYNQELGEARRIISQNLNLRVLLTKNMELEKALEKSLIKQNKLKDIIDHMRKATPEKLEKYREARQSHLQEAVKEASKLLHEVEQIEVGGMDVGYVLGSMRLPAEDTQPAAKLTSRGKRGGRR
jgi:chromosome segregation ATPase